MLEQLCGGGGGELWRFAGPAAPPAANQSISAYSLL